MFFLIKQSLPLNKQAARQEVFDLDEKLLESKYSNSELDNSLDLQWAFTNLVISELQEKPDLLNQEQQNILKSKLETEAALLTSKSKLVEQLQTYQMALNQSCAFEEEKVEILSTGCDNFMSKPFHDHELLTKIGQYPKVEYLYEDGDRLSTYEQSSLRDLTAEDLAVMMLKWRSQLYEAATKVDNQEIYQLLAEITAEYKSFAQGLETLVEFRCDKIIDLAKSVNQ